MKIKFFLYIYLLLSGTFVYAQVPLDVNPPPKKQVVDSAAIFQAKYDSLVKYMMSTYHLDSNEFTQEQDSLVDDSSTLVKTVDSLNQSIQTETVVHPKDALTVVVPRIPLSQPKESNVSVTTIATTTNQNPVDTPTPAKPIVQPPVDQDESPYGEDINPEQLLVDSIEIIDSEGDEAESRGDEEGEFDKQFTGYSDVSYWDLWRDPNFKFQQAMIPAGHHYPFDWDTITINPYKISLADMNDTILLLLKDSMDCAFHPPAIGDLTSGFGPRRWGRKLKFHYGVDVRMEIGDPVYAIFDGVVRIAKRSTDYGYVVLIRHYNGLETLYAHFDQLLVYPGKPVRSGEIIGLSGNTGRSTGPHLHFEVRFKGEKIDPNKIIYFPSGSLLSDTLQIDRQCFSHLKLYKAQQAKLQTRYYVVKRGDTLGKIAYKTGVPVKTLARLNRISSKTKLKAGRRIRLR